jgi:hypothetical protein
MSLDHSRRRDPAKIAAKRKRQRAAGYSGVRRGIRSKSKTHATAPWYVKMARSGERWLDALE